MTQSHFLSDVRQHTKGHLMRNLTCLQYFVPLNFLKIILLFYWELSLMDVTIHALPLEGLGNLEIPLKTKTC